MQIRGNLVYTVNQESPPYRQLESHYENGQKEWERRFKDGVEDGVWIEWYENGQSQRVLTKTSLIKLASGLSGMTMGKSTHKGLTTTESEKGNGVGGTQMGK